MIRARRARIVATIGPASRDRIRELAEKGQQLLDELYAKYLDRAYTTSIWSELVEP